MEPTTTPPIPTPDGQMTSATPPPPGTESRRGGCLTAFLVLMLIVNPLCALVYLVFGKTIAATIPGFPSWAIPVMGIAGVLNFICALGIWNRKRWGAYGFLAISAVVFVINIVTVGFGSSIGGLIGVGILLALLREEWKYMA